MYYLRPGGSSVKTTDLGEPEDTASPSLLHSAMPSLSRPWEKPNFHLQNKHNSVHFFNCQLYRTSKVRWAKKKFDRSYYLLIRKKTSRGRDPECELLNIGAVSVPDGIVRAKMFKKNCRWYVHWSGQHLPSSSSVELPPVESRAFRPWNCKAYIFLWIK